MARISYPVPSARASLAAFLARPALITTCPDVRMKAALRALQDPSLKIFAPRFVPTALKEATVQARERRQGWSGSRVPQERTLPRLERATSQPASTATRAPKGRRLAQRALRLVANAERAHTPLRRAALPSVLTAPREAFRTAEVRRAARIVQWATSAPWEPPHSCLAWRVPTRISPTSRTPTIAPSAMPATHARPVRRSRAHARRARTRRRPGIPNVDRAKAAPTRIRAARPRVRTARQAISALRVQRRSFHAWRVRIRMSPTSFTPTTAPRAPLARRARPARGTILFALQAPSIRT